MVELDQAPVGRAELLVGDSGANAENLVGIGAAQGLCQIQGRGPGARYADQRLAVRSERR